MNSHPYRDGRSSTRADGGAGSRLGRRIAASALLAALALSTAAATATSAVAADTARPKVATKRRAAAKPKAPRPPVLPTRCTELGVYRDDPVGTFPGLARSFGANLTTVSTYVTTGRSLDPRLVKLARERGLRLLVSWMPDAGEDDPDNRRYALANLLNGSLDGDLRALAGELKAAGVPVLFRPMPEPNTPWYSWSGLANGNTPDQYVAAWRRVRSIVKRHGGLRVNMLWSPYVRSVPETPENAIEKYFPGAGQVDYVGVSGYNFGNVGDLAWTTPKDLFVSAYASIEALARKPFWITETASTAAGGEQAQWVSALRSLRLDMPMLRGVVWFDVADPTGDFRLAGPALQAARSFLKGRCIV